MNVESSEVMMDVPADTGAALLGWDCDYRGIYHQVLLQNVNALERSSDRANYRALIQSSGSGKSRMVDEQAKLVFTIPLNIRDPEERWGAPYPPKDVCVWEYLCKTRVEDVAECVMRANVFFAILFSEVATCVDRVFAGETGLAPGDVARRWREYLLEKRVNLYRGVVQACNEVLSEGVPFEIEDAPSEQLGVLLAVLDRTCAFTKPDDVKVVLYFDEAHELYPVIQEEEHTRYHAMLSSLACFKSALVFTVFISTEMPPMVLDAHRQHFFTETAFDCHPSFPLRAGEHRLADLAELGFLARFGRPLYWTMLIHGETSSLLEQMMALARKKLVYKRATLEHTQTRASLIAPLDVLISLDYDPRLMAATELEVEMVNKHMRTVFSMQVDNGCPSVFSGYPSEPFMAEAASREVYLVKKEHRNDGMLNSLEKNIRDRFVDGTKKKEMLVRLFLRRAYLDAVASEYQGSPKFTPNFSRGCRLVRFLETLFSREMRSTILECKPNNGVDAERPLASAFERAVVRFTHFIRFVDRDSMPTTREMAMVFLRGAAFTFTEGSGRGISVAIPILLDGDGMVTEGNMSVMVVRTVLEHQSDEWDFVDEKDLFRGDDARPYVTLVARLDGGSKSQSPDVAHSDSDSDSDSDVTVVHPRYALRAVGFTGAVWGEGVYHWDWYSSMEFPRDDVLAFHERQDEASLEAVGRMLPFAFPGGWCRGSKIQNMSGMIYVSGFA